MEFEFRGVRYGFSFGFFALLAVYMLLDREGIGLSCLAAIALHESGHIVLMQLGGARIEGMYFSPFGVRLDKRGLVSYNREMLIYTGGVAANAAAAAIGWLLSGVSVFVVVNLLLLGFNLLPIGRLDGGVLLRLLFERAGAAEQGERVSRIVGMAFLSGLLLASLWMARQGNFTLLLTTAYLGGALVRR